jgi:hypothetical protein
VTPRRQEERVARKTGGRRQPGSGSGWLHPNDVRDDERLWEMKQTGKKQITVRLADWEKLRRNALLMGRTPIMHLEMGGRRLVVLDEGDYLDG